MHTRIVYDKPGRIRFRAGAYAFEPEHEPRIHKACVANPYVKRAVVHSENGGILIEYETGSHEQFNREQLIAFIQKLDLATLPEGEPDTAYQLQALDSRFKNKLAFMLARRYLFKWFVPLPIRTAVHIYKGLKYVVKGLDILSQGKLTVEVLDGAAIGASLLQRNYNSAGTIMFLLSVSGLLEEYTKARTRTALTASLAVKVDLVWVVKDGVDVQMHLQDVKEGDLVRIRSGAMIPVDGTVVEGDAFVNEATMTGESQAVHKSAGKSVFAGTILDEGSIVVSVRAVNGNTKIQKIIELIDQSEDLKASIQSKAERLADSIVPYSFLGFGLTLLFTRNVTKAVSILMVDYSCAIKLSTPISVISALREAADRNMTVKGGKYLEEFALADTIVFDKTGTLTKAEPKLEKVIPFNDRSEEEVLRIAACIEEHFPHSMARAIVRGALDRGIDHEEEHADVKYIVAHGIATTLNGERAVIGSKHFVVEDEHVTVSDTEQKRIDELAGAASVIYLGIGGKLAGVLCISDPPRDEAAEAIRMLRERGIKHVAMITGDSQKAAERTAQLLGIDIFYAQVLPEDKHRYVEKMKAEGHRVIMVGDGINDAPALAAANVSVALSDASDIARETADVTLRSEDLRDLAELKDLSIQLMDKIQANYRFIVTFNTALLAAGFFGILTPSTSALLHNMSTMGICAKSMMPLKQHAPAKRS
ncbi:MAG: heavy metal translocating P-type ATPase [Fibrobacter sp.]|nr:heavy metal translocating P-type ATPase [Fibrobacter sp.]